MLRLRSCIAARLFSSTSAAPISQLHRFVSAAAAASAVSPHPSFAVDDYLVETCGLTRAETLKASTKLSHLNSPTNPDAVLAFLAGLGLSGTDVAAIVAREAETPSSSAPVWTEFWDLMLRGSPVSAYRVLRSRALPRSPPSASAGGPSSPTYCTANSLFGSYENLLRVLKFNSNLLGCNLERIVKPNIAILRDCGLGDCDIAKLGIALPRMLTANCKHLQAMVACAEGVGVPRGSGMFRQALHAVAFIGEEKIATRVGNLKSTFMWLEAEVSIAVSKLPMILTRSKDNLQRKSEFLISEVGLKPPYIAHRPAMLTYSLEGRLRPRYYVVKFMKENGLLDRDYYSIVAYVEKVFMDKLICPHKEAAPHLAEDYEAACRGKVPTRFRFA